MNKKAAGVTLDNPKGPEGVDEYGRRLLSGSSALTDRCHEFESQVQG